MTDLLLIRRRGRVEVGESISPVAVSASGSKAAFAARSHGLARIKLMQTIIKKENYFLNLNPRHQW